MIEKHAMTLQGTSGKAYNFVVFPLEKQYAETDGAVYIVTICKQEESGSFSFNHSPVYLGETDCLAGHFDAHPKAECFRLAAQALKATPEDIAVGSILAKDAAKRKEIVKDLQGKFKWVCNGWKG